MTSFGKIRVEGRDAARFLNRVCSAEVDVPLGKIVYTMFLNAKGGIEADVTVTRLSQTAYLIVVPGATLQRDLAWLRRHLGEDFAVVTDVTAAESVLCVMGPKAREVLVADHAGRSVERGASVWHGARDRGRHGFGPGASGDLCGRTRVGVVCLG